MTNLLTDPSRRSPKRVPRATRARGERGLGFSNLPQRVILYLAEYGPGIEKSTAVICEDLECDEKQFGNRMRTAVARGVVTKRQVDGGFLWAVPARRAVA